MGRRGEPGATATTITRGRVTTTTTETCRPRQTWRQAAYFVKHEDKLKKRRFEQKLAENKI